MKKYKLLIITLISIFAFFSCEEESNLDPVGEWDLSDPQLTLPTDGQSIVLEKEKASEIIRFEWNEAVSSENYLVTYTLVIDTVGSDSFDSPILQVNSGEGGEESFVEISQEQIDQALSMVGYGAGENVETDVAVVANSVGKISTDLISVSFSRFEMEAIPTLLYVTGTATESGSDVEEAIAMRSITDADGAPTNIFELYTSLSSNGSFRFVGQPSEGAINYGGSQGELVKNGDDITVDEESVYRITVDFDENTYTILKVDKWSVVGNLIPGGWDGDEPLEYQGESVWKASLYLDYGDNDAGGFLFRLNGSYDYLMKRIVGTQDELVLESQADLYGVEYEDVPFVGEAGQYFVTLSLKGGAYTYSIEEDNSVTPPDEIPETLFLLDNDGTVIHDFFKDGNKFECDIYLALQNSKSYYFNSKSDGTGITFNPTEMLGVADNTAADKVAGNNDFGTGGLPFGVAVDQAYYVSVNFETAKVVWHYYNIKLFHWDEPGGGWDDRNEYLMNYVHPYSFEVTAELNAGYHMKFNSPWDIQFGADDPTQMTGTMINNWWSNFECITETGTYDVVIDIAEDYSTGNYAFTAQ
jgi:hypothetical protein